VKHGAKKVQTLAEALESLKQVCMDERESQEMNAISALSDLKRSCLWAPALRVPVRVGKDPVVSPAKRGGLG